MKKELLTSLLILLPFVSYAEDNKKDDPDVINLKHEKKGGVTPWSLYENEVTCTYDGNVLSLSFEQSEGWATLTLMSLWDGASQVYSFNTALPLTLTIGEVIGAHQITITTSTSVYTGYLN